MADATPPAIAPVPESGPSLRGIGAAVVGVVAYRLVTMLLETMLVWSNSDAPPPDYAAYYAVLSRPGVAGAKLVTDSLAAVWAGYMAARVAGERELTYGLLAALVITVQLGWQHLAGEFAAATPLWMRAGLLLLTAPAMLAGAWVRGRARVVSGVNAPGRAQEPGTP